MPARPAEPHQPARRHPHTAEKRGVGATVDETAAPPPLRPTPFLPLPRWRTTGQGSKGDRGGNNRTG